MRAIRSILMVMALVGTVALAAPEPPVALDGLPRRPYLGLVVLPLEPANALRLGLPSPEGAWIQLLAAGAPADDAGLRVDDVVVAVDDAPVTSPADVERLTAHVTPGTPLRFEVIRGGRSRTVTVTPGVTPLERRADLRTVYDAVEVAPDLRLRRILVQPRDRGPHPTVLLVQEASAPSVEAGGFNPARELAAGLAARGVATIRFDRRGVGDSEGATYRDRTLAEEVADTRAVLTHALADARVHPDSVYLLGLGTGALVAASLADGELPVAGLVAVNAPGRPLWDVVADGFAAFSPDDEQLREVVAPAIRSAYARLAAGESIEAILADRPGWRSFLLDPAGRVHGRVAAYHAALGATDPATRMRTVTVPVLVMRGEVDLITTPEDLARLDRALAARDGGSHHTVTLPRTGHLLAHAEDADDARRVLHRGELFFNPAVLDSVATWITGRPVAAGPPRLPRRLGAERRSP